jgi:peptide/nickel transport system ATP-binding protein
MTSTMTADSVVWARDVSRQYGSGRVTLGGVADATLRVEQGEIVGVRGPSGSGKSTLLRLLSGVERPDRGNIEFAGQPLWSGGRHLRRQRLARYPRPGYVMPIYQDPFASLDPRWPIWRTMTEPLLAPHVSAGPAVVPEGAEGADDHRETVRLLLARSGMEHVDIDARPAELSGGQCQRIAILRAMIARPALIVADEPTARQDVITAAAMTEQLTETAQGGTAIVVVSHNTAWLEGFSHRIFELVDGRLIARGRHDH